MEQLTTEDYWRSIILFGRNSATYKIALARCLLDYAARGRNRIPWRDLARDFLVLYRERVRTGRPQLARPGHATIMERIVDGYEAGAFTEAEAVARIAREAFQDVVPRFHTVGNRPLSVRFYETTRSGLVLTDALPGLLERVSDQDLQRELGGRWDLLEGAFAVHHQHFALENDVRRFYLRRGYQRTSLTPLRPVLRSYQQGRCFYCGDPLEGDTGEVDHVIPRQVLQNDQVWNLVLAHSLCNQQKSDFLPGWGFLNKLVVRNEHLIASNHPLRDRIIRDLGDSRARREAAVKAHYLRAKAVIRLTWDKARGYDPATDPLLRKMNQFLRMVSHDKL